MIKENLNQIKASLPASVTLIAVSKTKPVQDILEAYESGQKDFGENKAQEMTIKYQQLPKDIRWHMIGHLQRNKVKYIAPFVSLIHSVDGYPLLQTIQKEAEKNKRTIPCLLQVFIATEESKFGLDEKELMELCAQIAENQFPNLDIKGLMGMASFTEDELLIKSEFRKLKKLFNQLKNTYFKNKTGFDILSMGMSGDYKIAIEEGSTMIRIGSSIFGERNYAPAPSDNE